MKKLILDGAVTLVSLGPFAQNDSINAMLRSTINNNMSMMGTIDTLTDKWLAMRDEKMMVMKNGKMKMMKRNMTMKDSTRIMMDGTMMKTNNTTLLMQSGDYLTIDGTTWLKKDMYPNY